MGLDGLVATGLDIDLLRLETPGCSHVTHLNNAGAALPPAAVTDTVIGHLNREALLGPYEAHAEAAQRIDAVYASVAGLIGCRTDQVALVESATSAWTRAFSALHYTRPLREGDRILVASSEYASNVLPIMQVCQATGARLEFIPDDEAGCVDIAALAGMLDEQVALVAVSHCPSHSGLVNDVAGVGAALAGSEAWYIVDACQSVGQLPVDVIGIGADFVAATGRKFLRGPRGTGFLYASDRALDELEPFPLDLNSGTWLSHGYEVQESARRFEYWEKSYAALLGLGAAVDLAVTCGIEALAARIGELAEYARTMLATVPGVVVRDRGTVRSGIVTFTSDMVPAVDLVARIRSTGINVSLSTPDYARRDFDLRGLTGMVRASPHAYNTTDEVDRLVAAVRAA
jgi:selenocysteine lyase/cysteine desulfurase